MDGFRFELHFFPDEGYLVLDSIIYSSKGYNNAKSTTQQVVLFALFDNALFKLFSKVRW